VRALRALLALTALLSLATGTARADEPGWAALAQRIAAHDRYGDLSAALGAEPPGFVFPLSVRPALPVLGSTWFASKANEQPLFAHVYYAPTSHTGTASEALFAQLRAAGYTRVPDPYAFPTYARETEQGLQHMCPRDLQRPAIDVTIGQIDGLPALDLAVSLHAESTLCRDAVVAPQVNAQMPALTGIPELSVRMRMGGPAFGGAPAFSSATVRTALPPADAVAKIAERFTAKGWNARAAVVAGETITQRFAFAGAVRRSEALLVFDRRGEGTYILMIALSDSAVPAVR
jgi:hypothetical protein